MLSPNASIPQYYVFLCRKTLQSNGSPGVQFVG